MDVLSLYLQTLDECGPERLMRECLNPSPSPSPCPSPNDEQKSRARARARARAGDVPRNVVAIGKCAGPLLDGFGDFDAAFVAMPEGYREPRSRANVYKGGHPDMTSASFAAGRALLDFVDAHDDITFLVSGGGSACVEVPLPPHTEEELIAKNRELIASGLPIGEMNRVRRTLSAIKGGRLGGRVKGRCVTFVYSDVSTGKLEDVASGPSLRDLRLIADNTTLVRTAARIAREHGMLPVVIDEQIETDVEEAARFLAAQKHDLVIAGGEPTVVVRGSGKGGRCSELAVRFSLHCDERVQALFASSDGVDGTSETAGWFLRLPATFDRVAAERELLHSNSAAAAATLAERIIIPSAGNNLRDLYILARG
jgi:glycerate 2-kinase